MAMRMARFAPDLLAQPAEEQGAGEARELGDEQGQDEVVGLEPDGQAVIDSHAYDGVHPVDVEPVRQQEEKDHPPLPDLREDGPELVKTGPDHGEARGLAPDAALPHEEHERQGEEGATICPR